MIHSFFGNLSKKKVNKTSAKFDSNTNKPSTAHVKVSTDPASVKRESSVKQKKKSSVSSVKQKKKSSAKVSDVNDGERQQSLSKLLKFLHSAAAAAQYSPSETKGDGYCAIRSILPQLKMLGIEVK